MEHRKTEIEEDYASKKKDLELIASMLRKKKKEDLINTKRSADFSYVLIMKEKAASLSKFSETLEKNQDNYLLCSVQLIKLIKKTDFVPIEFFNDSIKYLAACTQKENANKQYQLAIVKEGIIPIITKQLLGGPNDLTYDCLVILSNTTSFCKPENEINLDIKFIEWMVSTLLPTSSVGTHLLYTTIGNIARLSIDIKEVILKSGLLNQIKLTIGMKELEIEIIQSIAYCLYNIVSSPGKIHNSILQFIEFYTDRLLLINDTEVITYALNTLISLSDISNYSMGDTISYGMIICILKLIKHENTNVSLQALILINAICEYRTGVKYCLESKALEYIFHCLTLDNRMALYAGNTLKVIAEDGSYIEYLIKENAFELAAEQCLKYEENILKDRLVLFICHGVLNCPDFKKIVSANCIQCILWSLQYNQMRNHEVLTMIKAVDIITSKKDDQPYLLFKCNGGYMYLEKFVFFPGSQIFTLVKEILDMDK